MAGASPQGVPLRRLARRAGARDCRHRPHRPPRLSARVSRLSRRCLARCEPEAARQGCVAGGVLKPPFPPVQIANGRGRAMLEPGRFTVTLGGPFRTARASREGLPYAPGLRFVVASEPCAGRDGEARAEPAWWA